MVTLVSRKYRYGESMDHSLAWFTRTVVLPVVVPGGRSTSDVARRGDVNVDVSIGDGGLGVGGGDERAEALDVGWVSDVEDEAGVAVGWVPASRPLT